MNCAACRYFEPKPSIDLSPEAAGGVCRRNAPQLFPIPARPPQGFAIFADWPPVKRSSWCGEFRPKLEAVS